MSFVHPEFLFLAPLLALPILIHLLNRIRYRRVRWAAIAFLLKSERRAVRRARLRQIILMMLRTLLLAGALGSLLQPILGGGLAALLGGSKQVAVLVDASASMSASDANEDAFSIAKTLAKEKLTGLSRNATATGGTFAVGYQSPFREPLADHGHVASYIESSELTAGAGDIPASIRGAAKSLAPTGGGTIWILTDMQASGWRIADTGTWQETLQALEDAGNPRLIISDLGPKISANFSIVDVRTTPAVLIEGDTPRLVATIQFRGEPQESGPAEGVSSVVLFFEGERIDRRVLQFKKPGTKEIVFDLPKLSAGPHEGYLELEADAVPADDRHNFVLRATGRVPLLVVDGAPSSAPFAGAADFLELAVEPPVSQASIRSPFVTDTITVGQLATANINDYAAVFLADVPRLDARSVAQLNKYVEDGGMVMIFAGSHMDIPEWNNSGFPGVPMKSIVEVRKDKAITVDWVSPTSPITATLPVEGLERLMITRLLRFDGEPKGQVLAKTSDGDPFLISLQRGKGKIYIFSVSCQSDFSNLPFTPVFLLLVHRATLAHLMEVREPTSRDAFSELELFLPPGRYQILTPNGQLLPVPAANGSASSIFSSTGHAGFYRLIEGEPTQEKIENAPPVAAINVPREESSLERIDRHTILRLLPGYPSINITRAGSGEEQEFSEGTGAKSAASSFPLAMLAIACLLGEVFLGWRIGRPSQDRPEEQRAQNLRNS